MLHRYLQWNAVKWRSTPLKIPEKSEPFFAGAREARCFFWLDQDGKTYVKNDISCIFFIPMPSTTMAWSMGTLEGDPGYADTAFLWPVAMVATSEWDRLMIFFYVLFGKDLMIWYGSIFWGEMWKTSSTLQICTDTDLLGSVRCCSSGIHPIHGLPWENVRGIPPLW